ncbi:MULTISPECIES: MgtC/SapB family protein [unclassified Cupriavidus]|uniref:MgtC/SapB family protein n=1 Tax=unclassified Cupriavidus TaxID=2640874 RepID=UPI0010F4623B|nr:MULTISPECIES: MgtC/SapB family protein [unclassified Cupriavidus]MWL86391.1 MgtC/SapB family protein [Cupriavidus sp. SW-Y-13]
MDGIWGEVYSTLRAEFADVNNVSELTKILVRLTLACLLGGLIGWERESAGKAAGLRTHMLVAMGAALFVLVPLLAGTPLADMSRVLQGLIAGIGFLGAGAIIKHTDEKEIRGLTTAASIWTVAAIGVACGLGRESTAVIATLFGLAILQLLFRMEKRAS